MGYLDFLPTFSVVEINTSTGLRAGHVLSQYALSATARAACATTTNSIDYLENGLILGLSSDLEVDVFSAASHNQPFLHFTEELNTLQDALKYFAVKEDADEAIYPRLVGLYVGDTFTTDNFTGGGTAGAYDDEAFAKVTDGKLVLQDTADDDTLFAVEESTLPTGEEAVRVTYLGIKTLDIALTAAEAADAA